MGWIQDLISLLFRRETDQENKKTFDEIYEDMGVFEYDADGFSIKHKEFTKKLRWDEITYLIAYKRDLYTIDRIELEIVYGSYAFCISEDLPGWFQFVKKTKDIYPTIPIDWDIKIIQPAYKTNITTIYDRSLNVAIDK